MITPYSNIISVTTEKFPFEFTINTANTSTGSTAADQFKLPLVSSLPLNAVVNWGDGSSDTITVFNQAETTHTYASAGSYTVSITGDLSGWAFANGGDKLKILNVASWESLIINESSIFRGCTNLTSNALDAPNNITTLFEAFRDCPNFNGNISSWDVSQVSSFQSCFFGASSFNQNIGGWNVSNATTMTSMFRSFVGHAFNQNLGSWDVSNVQFMDNMFSGSNSFNNGGLDLIKNWDVSNVQYMNNMFELATAFNQDIGSWDVSNVSFFSNFMDGKTAANYSATNLDSIYNNWSLLTVNPNLSISFGSIKYSTAGTIGKNRLLNSPNNWVITDGGQVAPFEFTVKTDNAGVSSSTEFRMPLTTSTDLGFTVNWGDGVVETITDHALAVHDYGVAGTYTISVTGSILGWQFANGGDKLKMLNVLQWSGLNISVDYGFYGCTNLTCSAIDAPEITSTNLEGYFRSCTNFNGAIGNWNISSVNSLLGMFLFADNFNQNIGSWNVGNVNNFGFMFYVALSFNNGGSSDINNWTIKNTGSVDMTFMFRDSPFNQNIGSWDTSAVTNMANMFQNCLFNQDIGSWNISNVTNFANFMASKTAANYDALYLSNIYEQWSQLTLQPNLSINFGTIQYFPYAQAGKDVLTNAPNTWVIVDGGTTATNPFQFTIDTTSTSTGSTGVDQFKLPLVNDGNALNSYVYWGDGTRSIITAFDQAEVTHTYPSSGNYMINIVGALSGWQFANGGDKLKMLNVLQWGDLNISTDQGFFGCTNLTCSATDAPTITTTSLALYFGLCTNFNGAIGNWNLSNVSSINQMFNRATNFNQNIGSWNVSNVTNMLGTFANTTAFNQNINSWNVASVTTMQNMFAFAIGFDQNIGSWNISNVTDLSYMMDGKSHLDYSAANLDSIYNGWSSLPSVQPNLSISFGSIKYTAAGQAGKDILTNAPNNWSITDGGI